MSGAALRPGQMAHRLLLGEPVLLCRKASGEVFALRDVCPHRGIPLSDGCFDGHEVECGYHGWKFNAAGRCTHIPSLTGHENIIPENIAVRHYPVREAAGNIWIFMPESKDKIPAQLPEIPVIPDFTRPPDLVETLRFPCHIDHAVIGLMDPAHGPFVHQSWWWRSRRSIAASPSENCTSATASRRTGSPSCDCTGNERSASRSERRSGRSVTRIGIWRSARS